MIMIQNQEKKTLTALADIIQSRRGPVDCTGVSGSERAYLVSRVYKTLGQPVLVIVATPKEGEKFLEDLHFFLGPDRPYTAFFPSYNILPYTSLSYHAETAAKRMGILYQLMESKTSPIVVTTVGALLQKLVPRQEIRDYAELVMAGEEMDRDLLVEKLNAGGYTRSTIVEEPGDYCIRGGILDVFPPMYSDPVRIEFFGDMVDSIRFFSAASQRKTKSISEVVILPAGEVILKKECMVQIIGRIRKHASSLDLPVTKVREWVDRIKEEGFFPGIENLIPLIYPRLDTFLDYVPENALFVPADPEELENAAEKLENSVSKNFLMARNDGRLCVEPDGLYMKWKQAKDILFSKKPLALKMLAVSKGEGDARQDTLQSSVAPCRLDQG
jgi:transcription-repair coupling factor (superfamily II helicase)